MPGLLRVPFVSTIAASSCGSRLSLVSSSTLPFLPCPLNPKYSVKGALGGAFADFGFCPLVLFQVFVAAFMMDAVCCACFRANH